LEIQLKHIPQHFYINRDLKPLLTNNNFLQSLTRRLILNERSMQENIGQTNILIFKEQFFWPL